MRIFKDNTGREWPVAVDVAAVKRVRSLVDVDLLEAIEGKLLERLVDDPVLLCDVIYCLMKPEADRRGVSDEDFGQSMAGDALDNATEAFLGELVDFFPNGRRALLAKALRKLKDLEDKALEAGHKYLESPALEAQMDAALAGLGASSGSLQGSSDVTPEV